MHLGSGGGGAKANSRDLKPPAHQHFTVNSPKDYRAFYVYFQFMNITPKFLIKNNFKKCLTKFTDCTGKLFNYFEFTKNTFVFVTM